MSSTSPLPSSAPTPAAPPLAVVTGGSRGIGLAIVRLFLARGYEIVTCSREPPDPAERAQAGWLHHLAADLSDRDDTEKFAAEVMALLPGRPLTALINNAAVSPKTPFKERLGCLNGDLGLWHQVFELNFFAPLVLSRRFARPLATARGAIVNITSIAGHAIHPFAGSAYSTSKAGLSALTREMAVEFAQIGVRVNAVAPGEIETAMLSAEYEALVPRIPLGRLGSPEDVAGVVHWLCSPDAGYVTGTEVFVTGGQHLF